MRQVNRLMGGHWRGDKRAGVLQVASLVGVLRMGASLFLACQVLVALFIQGQSPGDGVLDAQDGQSRFVERVDYDDGAGAALDLASWCCDDAGGLVAFLFGVAIGCPLWWWSWAGVLDLCFLLEFDGIGAFVVW